MVRNAVAREAVAANNRFKDVAIPYLLARPAAVRIIQADGKP